MLTTAHLVQFGSLELTTVAVAAVLGIGVGWIGWRVSAPLRTLVEV